MNYNQIVKEKYRNLPYDYRSFSNTNIQLEAFILFGMCPLCLIVYAPILVYDSMKNLYSDNKRKVNNSIVNYKNQELLCANVFMERYSMNQESYSWCNEKNKFTDYLESKFIFPQILDSYDKTFEKFLVNDKFIKPIEMTKLIEDNISTDVSEKALEFCKKYNLKDHGNYGFYTTTTFVDFFWM